MTTDIYKIYHDAIYGVYEIYRNDNFLCTSSSQQKAEELVNKLLKQGYDTDGKKLIGTIGG